MYKENTQYQRTLDVLKCLCKSTTSLKQRNSATTILFNLAPKKVIREMQMEITGAAIGQNCVLGFFYTRFKYFWKLLGEIRKKQFKSFAE